MENWFGKIPEYLAKRVWSIYRNHPLWAKIWEEVPHPCELLDTLTKDYRLLRLDKVSPQTGKDGPGEYSWVWQVISFVLIIVLILKKRKI